MIGLSPAYRLVVERHEAEPPWLALVRAVLVVEEVKLLQLPISLQQLQQAESVNITTWNIVGWIYSYVTLPIDTRKPASKIKFYF